MLMEWPGRRPRRRRFSTACGGWRSSATSPLSISPRSTAALETWSNPSNGSPRRATSDATTLSFSIASRMRTRCGGTPDFRRWFHVRPAPSRVLQNRFNSLRPYLSARPRLLSSAPLRSAWWSARHVNEQRVPPCAEPWTAVVLAVHAAPYVHAVRLDIALKPGRLVDRKGRTAEVAHVRAIFVEVQKGTHSCVGMAIGRYQPHPPLRVRYLPAIRNSGIGKR